MPKKPVSKTTPSLSYEQLAALRTLMPQAFSEGRIDPEKLRLTLGDHVDDRPERYSFSWAGKRDAIRLIQAPSRGTLIPARDESLNFDATQNLFVQGDNLEALKALLPYYAGQVKCIYIDPPYNTGNESWVYNDAVNSPEMRDRLGKAVGSEAEDLSRHDKWLCPI